MNALQLAFAVASDPRVTAYREAQQRYRTRMIQQYGEGFDNTSGQRGIHCWTPRQEDIYNSMMRGAAMERANVRKALASV